MIVYASTDISDQYPDQNVARHERATTRSVTSLVGRSFWFGADLDAGLVFPNSDDRFAESVGRILTGYTFLRIIPREHVCDYP